MKHTREELVYLMKFYQFKEMPIFDGGTFMGSITDDLRYTYHNAPRYYIHPDYAIEAACEFIDEYIEAVKKFKSKDIVSIEIDAYNDYNYKETTTDEGTYDRIFASFDRINNKLRYCNGHYYKFHDKGIENLYRIWLRWISEARSMELYYGNGIVD